MPDARKKSFQEAVAGTPDISACCRNGLEAVLQRHRSKILLQDPRGCEGSVDIDACVLAKYPNDSRWDYCFAYKGDVFFVEVHTANSSEVSTVIRKLTWLKEWLNKNAPGINELKARHVTPFYWIQSAGFNIPSHSSKYRQAYQAGIKPIPRLELNY